MKKDDFLENAEKSVIHEAIGRVWFSVSRLLLWNDFRQKRAWQIEAGYSCAGFGD